MSGELVKGLQSIRDFIWGPPLLVGLLGTGAYLMIRLRGLPIRRLPRAISLALSSGAKGEEYGKMESTETGFDKKETCAGDGKSAKIKGDEKEARIEGYENKARGRGRGSNEVSAFSCLATELAATIGTGNIIGVVGAMLLGGPGALFWMALSAFLGLSTKLVESTLSVKYRERRVGKLPLGGPMITLEKAFPRKRTGRFLAVCYAFFAVLCSLGMGNLVQANSIAESLQASMKWDRGRVGLFLSLLTIIAVLGGMKLVSRIATFLVPAMGALYLAGCLGIILMHPQNLLPGLASILIGAFSPRAASGGAFGLLTIHWTQGLGWGISRGVFSNEAGLGAGGISAAASSEQDPYRQGLISMSAVFFDTIVICSVTGIAYACSGIPAMISQGDVTLKNGSQANANNAADLMVAAFETTFGRYGGILLSVCITLFAFATILGWAVQGEAAFTYLFHEKYVLVFQLVYGVLPLAGAIFSLQTTWLLSDIANGLLAIPNLICLWALAPQICSDIRKRDARDEQ